jgi:hypothetical protein
MTKLFVFCFVVPFTILAQTVTLNVTLGSCTVFKGKLFSYGVAENMGKPELRLYKTGHDLVKTDSISQPVSIAFASLLKLSADTLHGYLNIHLHQKESNILDIYRFDGKQLIKIEKVEAARLNNAQMFDGRPYYIGNWVYSLRTVADSTGKQFYLNKFKLKNPEKNFDYELAWQFPFERKNIEDAYIIHADQQMITLFVYVSGQKKGQWLLRVSAATGMLVKAIKFNEKSELDDYHFGALHSDRVDKSLLLIGTKSNTIVSNKQKFFVCEIDSFSNFRFRQDLSSVLPAPTKPASNFLVKTESLIPLGSRRYQVMSDIYKSSNKSCYSYVNSVAYILEKKEEEEYVTSKWLIAVNPMIEQYFATADKRDLQGKICSETTLSHKVYYEQPGSPVKQAHKTDDLGNGHWILSKKSIAKGQQTVSLLKPEKSIYKVTNLLQSPTNAEPKILVLSEEKFLICHQTEDGKMKLAIYNW